MLVEEGPAAIEPLPGDYVARVQAIVADKADTFAPMTVVMGGTVYGVMGTLWVAFFLPVILVLGKPLWQRIRGG